MDMMEITQVLGIGAMAGALMVVTIQFFIKKYDGNKSYDFKDMVQYLNTRSPASRTKFIDMYYKRLRPTELEKMKVMLEHLIHVKSTQDAIIRGSSAQDNIATGSATHSQNGSLSNHGL